MKVVYWEAVKRHPENVFHLSEREGNVFFYPLKASNNEGIRLPRNISKMYIFSFHKYYLYNYRSVM